MNTQPVEAGECVCKVSDVRKEEEGKHGGDAKILVDDGGNHIDQYARHHGESCLCALVPLHFLFEEFTSRAPLPSSCHLVVWLIPTALATSWCLPYHKFIAPRGYWGLIFESPSFQPCWDSLNVTLVGCDTSPIKLNNMLGWTQGSLCLRQCSQELLAELC